MHSERITPIERCGGLFVALVLASSLIAPSPVNAIEKPGKKEAARAVGAWFGIARPCPPPPGDTSPEHAAFCTQVCGTCAGVPGTLPPEIVLTSSLLADGTILADDGAQLSLAHTIAHGRWAISEDDGLPDRPGTTRLRATFLWLGQNFFGSNKVDNAVRTRLVTYLDPADPDRMLGYIQPHFFSTTAPGFATSGIVNVVPSSPADPIAGDHVPFFDPLGTLPAGCVLPPSGSCFGTYHFVIRRIEAE